MSKWIFPHRAFQIDLARLVERPDTVIRELPRYADWGYNTAFLYMEGAFRYPSDSAIWRKHSWSPRDLGRYVDRATKHSIQIICCLPLFGHAGWLTEKRRQFDELREQKNGFGGQICPAADGLIEKVDQLLADIAPFNTHPILHIGFDESPTLGKCSRCRPVLEGQGEGEIVNRHLQQMADCVRRAGKTPGIWGDMFYYYPEKIPQIPKDVVVFDWFYYPFETTPRVASSSVSAKSTRPVRSGERGCASGGVHSATDSGLAISSRTGTNACAISAVGRNTAPRPVAKANSSPRGRKPTTHAITITPLMPRPRCSGPRAAGRPSRRP